jgi:uncharacterized protein (DUF779 family)
MTEVPRVKATTLALQLIQELRQKHGDILFHQSGGCCDGSSPMRFPSTEFKVSEGDVFLGALNEVPFYISGPQFEYWQHTQLIIDVVPGQGGMFSLENGSGKRFLTRSRLYAEDETPVPRIPSTKSSDAAGEKVL